MTIHSTKDLLQEALFKAAKVGNIKLMYEFIEAGADPFAYDEMGYNAITYAHIQDPDNTSALLLKL